MEHVGFIYSRCGGCDHKSRSLLTLNIIKIGARLIAMRAAEVAGSAGHGNWKY